MDLLGFTLNQMTLLALSLVAGVLVDDAIVEIENIVRQCGWARTAYQASIDAADEIGVAVLATTMSIVAVFLPVGLMPGLSGQFFKNFGLTVRRVGADEPRRGAPDNADDRGLFPQGQGAQAARRGPDHELVRRPAALDAAASLVGGGRRLRVAGADDRLLRVAADDLPADAGPGFGNRDGRMVPGTTLEDTELVVARVAAILKKEDIVEISTSAASTATAA